MSDEPRHLILTNLNPSIYRRQYVETFLSELIINSLLLLSVNLRLHIGNLSFHMPYCQDLIVPP